MKHLLNATYVWMLILTFGACEGEEDTTAPTVISTSPPNGSVDVDPALSELSVTFSEAMMEGNWSWAYDDLSKIPEIAGDAYFVDNNTKNILPVKLESDKEYVLWINSNLYQNFKDKSGNPSFPYRLTFKTAAGTP